jgi:5-methyltetrahydrofolate--homocysteine methyltransferase
MTGMLEFSMQDWQRIQRDYSGWWNGELERPLVFIEAKSKATELYRTDFLTQYPLDTAVDWILDLQEKTWENIELYGDAFPKWWPNFGPGVIAAFLGSGVEYATNTTWFTPMVDTDLKSLQLDFIETNPWWQRAYQFTQAAIERWGERVVIGHTDLGGNLDILAGLRGSSQMLFDLTDMPDRIEQLVQQVTRIWIDCYQKLYEMVEPVQHATTCWGPIWAPGKTYLLQSDFSYMISPRMFKRFVLPDLEACCKYLDFPFYHLDGKGQIAHLDFLLSIERLRGIQWIPGDGAPPPEEWLPLLRKIRQAGKLCQLYVTPEGAHKITSELGGKGFLFYLYSERVDHPPLTLKQAETFLTQWEAGGFR